ncbi:MAG TPA: DNA translocase FtsK 4TM domain-containing protein [Aliidongia sp.]|uniref:DNA translocase FtsK n=1 Tax=Aliidongia sp. TaxID=1914230 RepID=UPI002DDCB794|nr:DNA translocase FtsK 4TM domain-containing protein [Aliidongia sp.]HEV2677706.1 DNA translocase FtsK 4TM domain-containing protein [Aliidongia sp.]
MANLTATLDKTRDKTRDPGVKEFLRRRANELAGGAMFVASIILFLILATYDHGDPSWNQAVDRVPANFGGQSGAILADVLIQSVGVASVLVPTVVAIWSLRLLLQLPIRRVWLRLTLLPVLMVAAALSLGILPGSLGGVIGRLFWLKVGLGPLTGPVGAAIGGLVSLGLIYVLGLTRGEWREVGRGAGKMASASRLGGQVVAKAGGKVGLFTWNWGRSLADSSRRQVGGLGVERVPREPAIRVRRPSGDEQPAPLERREPTLGEPGTHHPAPREPVMGTRRELAPGVVAPKPAAPLPAKRAEQSRQPSLDLEPQNQYDLPPLDLLAPVPPSRGLSGPNEEALQQNALLLLNVLEDFGVKGEIVKVRPGPVVTLYELEPAPGTKSSRVIGLADDIARSMSAVSVRVAVVPGRNVIGIELPNAKSETVYLRELLASDAYERSSAKLSLVLGKDIGGAPIVADLAKMPHLLIAGTTGSGKSVGINTMILSVLYRMPPDQCKFIMIDPKMLELSIYDGIPHLLAPVVTDPKKAVVALKWTVREMENRYRAMSKLGVRNIEGYNARLAEARGRGEALSRRIQTGFDPESGEPQFEDQALDSNPLPFIVVVVDEMADLMLVAGKDIEAAIQRLAQMARAAGIHIIMATQRPSVDVITGTIKANFPTRISFQVTSKIDSRTILGESGAEQLLGRGDMLYMAGGGRITRVHGPFCSDGEVEAVVNFLKSQGQPSYIEEVTEDDQSDDGGEAAAEAGSDGGDGSNDLYDKAVALVTREKKASTSFVQRHLQIGYNRAARIMERMEQEGVVSQSNHVGKREVLAPPPR